MLGYVISLCSTKWLDLPKISSVCWRVEYKKLLVELMCYSTLAIVIVVVINIELLRGGNDTNHDTLKSFFWMADFTLFMPIHGNYSTCLCNIVSYRER